jgi:hypothetical protein
MAFCTKCGTRLEAGTAFCGNCGSSVAVAATPGTKSPASQHLDSETPAPVAPDKSAFAAMREAGKASIKPALIRAAILVVPIIVVAAFFVIYHKIDFRHAATASTTASDNPVGNQPASTTNDPDTAGSFAESQSAPQTYAPTAQSARILNSLRNTRLEIDKSITFDQAVERTFPNGAWKSLIAGSKGLIIVEFDSTWTFSKFVSTIGMAGCNANSGCASTISKIGDYCDKHPSKSCTQTQLDQNANTSIPVTLIFAFDPNTEKATESKNNLGINDEQLIHLLYK